MDADLIRAEILARWERAAATWGKHADLLRDAGMPASTWMIDQLGLQPGTCVLDLAAGPGDTGFLAAELIQPGGRLICSDGTEAMLEVARARAAALGVHNVEFKQLQLEWIDLPAAGVDAILCRWGLMFALDPAAALLETRRVLRPGGRIALSVWEQAEHNQWATIPQAVLVDLGLVPPPNPSMPGMFALGAPGLLASLLEHAGFCEVIVDVLELPRRFRDAGHFLQQTSEVSPTFGECWRGLDESSREQVRTEMERRAAPHSGPEGTLTLPGRALVAAAWA